MFLVIAIQSNAEMKITENGVTSPDESAVIHLSGSFSTEGSSVNPDGAIISGVNEYSGPYYTYGGYFEASGSNGRGVYGSASGIFGIGVYGSASNTGDGSHYGGYFEASGYNGMGVYGSASGSNGRGVWGSASNIGGYFEASDISGIGAYGITSGFTGRGVYGYASGNYGEGVHGHATGANGTGVIGEGMKYDFYASGEGANYAPFTGAHEVKFAEGIPVNAVPGWIVSVTGKTEARKTKTGTITLSSTLPTVTISTRPRDKAVFGVIVSEGPLPSDHWYKAEDGERFGVVNALGEGRVWVTDINGKIEAGDYITTSSVPGYGQMQDDDLLHSYTLGKAIETIDWDQVTETVQHDGKTYKRYLIAVVYTSG